MLNLGAIGNGTQSSGRPEFCGTAASSIFSLTATPVLFTAWARRSKEAPGNRTRRTSSALRPALEMPTPADGNEAWSASARWGKSFDAGGQTNGHVLVPHTSRPVAEGTVLAAVIRLSATDPDAPVHRCWSWARMPFATGVSLRYAK